MNNSKSPAPGDPVEKQDNRATVILPICPVCKGEIATITYQDFDAIRVVMHETPRCTIGVTNID